VPQAYWPCIFRTLEVAKQVLQETADEVARNGVPLKINFGQRFSWTPLCIFPFSRFHLADGSPPQAPRRQPNLSQYEFFLDVQSRLPQQSRYHRFFEA
jgi:hypothetical protein